MLGIKNRILSMYGTISKKQPGEPFTRYKSWEYCHKIFNEFHAKYLDNKSLTEEEYDLLALNLAFYLASWGMYRGSSFLLQRDYKTHIEAVKKIIAADNDLWNYDPRLHNENDDKKVAKAIIQLGKDVISTYSPIDERSISGGNNKYCFLVEYKDGTKPCEIIIVVNEEGECTIKKGGKKSVEIDDNSKHINYKHNSSWHDLGFDYGDPEFTEKSDYEPNSPIKMVTNEEQLSETLITKILMGTIGSVPAYDRFFKNAIRETPNENLTAQYNENGLISLYAYVRKHASEYADAVVPNYPVMKKVDMYFWQYGYELGFLEKDSQFQKLLQKEKQNTLTSGRDLASKKKMIAQINAFLEKKCTSLTECLDELSKRNTLNNKIILMK